MSHEDLFNAVMSVAHGTSTPRAAASRYHVTNRNILEVEINLESIREQWDTPLAESYKQQQMSSRVRSHLRLPLVQRRVCTYWELREACERRILMNSNYSEILEEFGLPNSTLWSTLNVIFPSLKCSSLKHLWDLIGVDKIAKTTVGEVIIHTVSKNRPGPKNYLLEY